MTETIERWKDCLNFHFNKYTIAINANGLAYQDNMPWKIPNHPINNISNHIIEPLSQLLCSPGKNKDIVHTRISAVTNFLSDHSIWFLLKWVKFNMLYLFCEELFYFFTNFFKNPTSLSNPAISSIFLWWKTFPFFGTNTISWLPVVQISATVS